MIVKVAPMGERVEEANVEEGTTVGSVIAITNVEINGRSIMVNNVAADENTILQPLANDQINYITLANKGKGGI